MEKVTLAIVELDSLHSPNKRKNVQEITAGRARGPGGESTPGRNRARRGGHIRDSADVSGRNKLSVIECNRVQQKNNRLRMPRWNCERRQDKSVILLMHRQ